MPQLIGPRFRKSIATALILSLCGAPLAQAKINGSFSDADVNHDGRVTLQEFEAYATKRLMVGTGFLAQRFRELSPQQQAARLQARFEKVDSGNKGYLTESDWNG